MHITLQQGQHPNPTLIENAHSRSTNFLAFAHPGKICLIYIFNEIQPLALLAEVLKESETGCELVG